MSDSLANALPAASSDPASPQTVNNSQPTAPAASEQDSALLRQTNAVIAEIQQKREAAASNRDDAKNPTPGPELSDAPSSDSEDDADVPLVLPQWMLEMAGVTAAELSQLRPHAFDAFDEFEQDRHGIQLWSYEEWKLRSEAWMIQIAGVRMDDLKQHLRVLQFEHLTPSREDMEELLLARLKLLRAVLQHQRKDSGQLELLTEIVRVLSDVNLSANAELRARHSEGEGGVPLAYLWTQGRLSELATSEDALLSAIKSYSSGAQLRDNDSIVMRSEPIPAVLKFEDRFQVTVRMAFEDDAKENVGSKGGVVWTPLSAAKTRVHASAPAVTDSLLLASIKQSPWLVFDPELQCARLSRRDEWPGDDLRVLSASQSLIVAEAHASFDSFHATAGKQAHGHDEVALTGPGLYQRVTSSIMARDSKPAMGWEAFSRACALSTTLHVHSHNTVFKLNEREKLKRIESFALLVDAGRTPPPALLPNAAAPNVVAAPSAAPSAVAAPSSKSTACYFRCTASVADLLVPSSSYSDLQRAEHDHAVLVWSLLPRPVASAAEQAEATNQPHRAFNNEKSNTISNPTPIYIVPAEVDAGNAAVSAPDAAAVSAPADAAALPVASRSSLTGSCSFSVRLTHLSPFNRLSLGFRQNSLFGCSHLLQLCMGAEGAAPPPGHGELRRMQHAQKFRHELFPGDELFQPVEADAQRSSSGSSLTAARQSIAQSSSTLLGRFNRLPPSVQREIEEGFTRSLEDSIPAQAPQAFAGSGHPMTAQLKQIARSLANGEIFEQRAEQMLEQETLGALPRVLTAFRDAVDAATTAVEMDRPAAKAPCDDSVAPRSGSNSEQPVPDDASPPLSGTPVIVPLPPVRLGSVFTVRYDAERDEIRFALNGAEIPEATCKCVLVRHAQPKDLPEATSSVDALHAMIPVMFASGLGVQVECVAEEEGIAEANKIAAMVDVASPAASSALVPMSSPLRDLAPAFAREQALLRASINSGSVENDTHQSYLVPCAASSIPGILRLFFHTYEIGLALGLPYFSIPIIEIITEYVQYTAPNLGTFKFGFMCFWASHVRANTLHSKSDKSHGLVSSLFATSFPFKSIPGNMASRTSDSGDVFHDLAAVGEISSSGCYPSGHPVTMSGPIGLWARFADKHPDTLRSEDYAQLERAAAEESRTALDRSVGSGNGEIESLDASAPVGSSSRKLLRDEDGQIIYDPDAASKEPVHSDVHPDEERDQWVATQPALPSAIPPFSLLTPEDLLRPPPSALVSAWFDLRVPPAAALDRLQMLRQSGYNEMEALQRGSTRMPWHLRVAHPPEAMHGSKELDTNQAIISSIVVAPAPAAASSAIPAGFIPANSPFNLFSLPFDAPAAASSLGGSLFAAPSPSSAASSGTKGVTWAHGVGGASAADGARSLAPAPTAAASSVAASSGPAGPPVLSPIPPASFAASASAVAAPTSAASAAPSSSSSSSSTRLCSLCAQTGHFESECPRQGSLLGDMLNSSFAGAAAPGGPGLVGLGFGSSAAAAGPPAGAGWSAAAAPFGAGAGVVAHQFASAARSPLAAGWAPGFDEYASREQVRVTTRIRGADAMHDGDDESARRFNNRERGRRGRR